MKLYKYKKGMTLIEVIVSIAILGIVSVVFLTMFTTGFKGIANAGKYSQVEYVGQKYMENKLAGMAVTGVPNLTSSTVNSATLNIGFTGGSTITVNGKIELIEYNDSKHNVKLATFVPN